MVKTKSYMDYNETLFFLSPKTYLLHMTYKTAMQVN